MECSALWGECERVVGDGYILVVDVASGFSDRHLITSVTKATTLCYVGQSLRTLLLVVA